MSDNLNLNQTRGVPDITTAQIYDKLAQLFVDRVIVKTEFGFYRSEMCKDFTAGRMCKFGENCHYAHGMADICPKPYEEFKFKVKQCTCQGLYKTGKPISFLSECNYGSRCEWRHDELIYVLTDENSGSTLIIYFSPEEKRFRIAWKPEKFEPRIFVISLVKPVVHDPTYEEYRPFLEAVRCIVDPQNPCDYFNNRNSQSPCRIIGLETISSRKEASIPGMVSVLNPCTAQSQPSSVQQVMLPGRLTPCVPTSLPYSTQKFAHQTAGTETPDFVIPEQQQQNFYVPFGAPQMPFIANPQFPMQPMFYDGQGQIASFGTPTSMQYGYAGTPTASVQMPMMSPQMQFGQFPMQPVFVDPHQEETFVVYNPESNMSETLSWSNAGDQQFSGNSSVQEQSVSPVNCFTPEGLPMAGATFLNTPTRSAQPMRSKPAKSRKQQTKQQHTRQTRSTNPAQRA